MPHDASTIFDSWLDRLESGEPTDFDSLLSAHPEHGEQLRQLHKAWSTLQTSLEGALPEPLPAESFFRAPATAESVVARLFTPEAGSVLGDFRLIRPLAQGGMGSVWEAEQVSLRRRVALKLLRPGRGAPRLLVREARVAGRLDHPGLVQVHAVGEEDGVTFIAQQLVGDGFTLADFLDRVRRLDRPPADYERRVARLVAEVADAVHAAHEAGVLHRDLKPQNILIDDEDRPRVTDFGLAHEALEGDAARPGLVGTLAYMSPEQAAGGDEEIDRRSDVFSLGAVLWEALTLRRAFDGDTAREVLDAVLHFDPPDPRAIRPRVPRDLAAICAKALRKPRDQRYASLRELGDDLRRFLRNEPVQAETESTLSLAWKWTLRHPAWSASLALGAAALVAISLVLLREIDAKSDAQKARDDAAAHARDADAAASLATQRALEARRQSYLANLRAADAAIERSGWSEARRLLEACPVEHRGWEWRVLTRRTQGALLPLDAGSGAVLCAAMTPDGRRLVTGCVDGTLHVWDGATGARLGVLPGHTGAVNAVAITDDGTRAVSGGADGSVRVWDLEHGGPLDLLPPGKAEPVDRPQAEPPSAVLAVACDGAGTVAIAGSEDSRVTTWPLDGSAPARSWESGQRAAIVSVSASADGQRFAVGTHYGGVEIWETATGAHYQLVPYEAPDVPVAMRPDGLQVATGGADGMLRVRDGVTGAVIVERKVHDGAIARVAFSRDALRILSIAPADTDVRAFSAVDLAPLPVHSGQEGRLTALATDAAGARVLAGALDGNAWLWLHDDAQRDAKLPSLSGAVLSLACDAHGERLLAAAMGPVGHRLIDLRDGTQGAPLAGTGGPPSAVALNGAGTLAALATLQEPLVDLLDPATGAVRARLAGPQGGVTDLCIAADGRTLLASSQDGRLYAWSLPDGALLATLEGHQSLVSSCAISADGQRAASASVDGTVRLWDVPAGTGRVLTSAAWYEDALVALSADGQRVASASIHSDAATVWNADTGEVLCTLTGHGTGVGALLFSPDGTRVFSASARDRAVRVWDARTGELLVLLAGHEAPVTALASSGDGRRLVSGAADGSLRAWDAGE